MATTFLDPATVRATLPTRDQIAAAIETFVAVLDIMYGDPDEQQADGDEEDNNASEDDFMNHGWGAGLGCPIADPGEEDDPLERNGDEKDTGNGEDEHICSPGNGLGTFGIDARPGCEITDPGEYAWPEWQSRGRHKNPEWTGTLPHEDAEDDDSDCGGDEGEPNFATPPIGEGPGCIISDSDYGGEEAGEHEDGVSPMHHGIDQTKPISNDNPVLI